MTLLQAWKARGDKIKRANWTLWLYKIGDIDSFKKGLLKSGVSQEEINDKAWETLAQGEAPLAAVERR